MKSLRLAALALLALAPSTFIHAAEPGFKSIFDGQTLAGWEGTPAVWSVRDGALTGQTTAEKGIKTNTFLVYTGAQPANFELRLAFRLWPCLHVGPCLRLWPRLALRLSLRLSLRLNP